MEKITVTAILRRHGKWITYNDFVKLVSKKRDVQERQAINIIKKAYRDREILKHIFSDRTTIYGIDEFGPPRISSKLDNEDFLNFAIDHDLISNEMFKRKTLPIDKVPKMFDKGDSFPLRIKDQGSLDIEQLLVLWFRDDVFQFLHAARKIIGNKNHVSDLERASKNIEGWISSTVKYISSGWEECLKWIAKEGKYSWEEILGSLEDNPLPLYQGLSKFEQLLLKARREERKKDEIKRETGEIESYDLRLDEKQS